MELKIFVRNNNLIGDSVMTLPAVKLLRQHFPDSFILMTSNPAVFPILKDVREVNDVIKYDEKWGLKKQINFIKFIKTFNFDIGITFAGGFGAALIMKLAGIKRRIGKSGDNRDFLLTDPVKIKFNPVKHQFLDYLSLLEPLGIKTQFPELPRIYIPEIEVVEVVKRTVKTTADFVVISPFAKGDWKKMWFPDRFRKLSELIVKKLNLSVVVVGSRDESRKAEEVFSGLPNTYIFTGKLNIRESAALMKGAKVVIANDTGTMHIATAVGSRVVVIAGPTLPSRTGPLAPPDRAKIIYDDFPCSPCKIKVRCKLSDKPLCMDSITVDRVFSAVEEFL